MNTLTANRENIVFWANRDKCMQCKHLFDNPYLLPVTNPQHGSLQPNFNVDAIYHMQETHGIPESTYREWITGSIYGQSLGEFGIKPGQTLTSVYRTDDKL